MEYQALYRKYRPLKFSDVVDQESTLKVLTNSLKEGHISHAYLFSGPRGTGKTTIAKLLAKTVNCLDLKDDFSICGKCNNCIDILNNSPDIIEIDAASNNGVDEIRELKSKINLVPNKLKYKVYIIDEVHMLSISAFNALLKTLEEPPSHVIFILATTEFYKVPETIISRCQCLNFSRIKVSSIESRLKQISNLEKINITDDAIHEIAEYSNGGMRDALGMLDKLSSYSLKEITKEDFLRINGLISKNDMDEFINNILTKNIKNTLEMLNSFDEKGYDFSKLIEKLMQEARDLMIEKINNNESTKDLYNLVMCFNDTYNLLKEAMNRKIIFEVNLLKFMNLESDKNDTVVKDKINVISQEINHQMLDNSEKKQIVNKKYIINEKIKRQRIDNTFCMASKELKINALNKFTKIDEYLTSSEYSYLAGLLKDCVLGVVSKNEMILTTKYDSIIDNVYSNYDDMLKFLKILMDENYVIVLLNDIEFNKEVLNYKKHMKENNYYKYKKETEPFIKIQEEIEKKENLEYTNLVDKAIDVFGTDIVEIE